METTRRGNHYTGGGEEEGDEEADGEVGDGEAAMLFAPALFKEGIREEEGHVDTDGRTKGGEGDVALLGGDLVAPEVGEIRFGDEGFVGGGGGEEGEGVRDVTAENFGNGKLAAGEEGDDDGEEGEHDDGDHELDNEVEGFRSFAIGLIEIVDEESGDEEGDDDGGLAGLACEDTEVLLDGSGGEGELGHGPDHVGHDGGDEPRPAEEGVEVAVDGMEGAVASGEGDVGDGGEHDDAANHGEGLDPHGAEAGGAAEKEGASEGAAAEGDGALQPAGAGEFGVGEEFFGGRGIGDGVDGGEFAFVLVGHGFFEKRKLVCYLWFWTVFPNLNRFRFSEAVI